MTARAIEVMAWHPLIPGSDSHVGMIRTGPPDLALVNPDEWDWHDRALCAETDPGLFHPADGESAAPALRVCRACDVRAQCLEWALGRDERFGVLGGTTERQRQAMRAGREPRDLAA